MSANLIGSGMSRSMIQRVRFAFGLASKTVRDEQLVTAVQPPSSGIPLSFRQHIDPVAFDALIRTWGLSDIEEFHGWSMVASQLASSQPLVFASAPRSEQRLGAICKAFAAERGFEVSWQPRRKRRRKIRLQGLGNLSMPMLPPVSRIQAGGIVDLETASICEADG